MSYIGKKTNRRTEVPIKMVTKVKESKKNYDRNQKKKELRDMQHEQ